MVGLFCRWVGRWSGGAVQLCHLVPLGATWAPKTRSLYLIQILYQIQTLGFWGCRWQKVAHGGAQVAHRWHMVRMCVYFDKFTVGKTQWVVSVTKMASGTTF